MTRILTGTRKGSTAGALLQSVFEVSGFDDRPAHAHRHRPGRLRPTLPGDRPHHRDRGGLPGARDPAAARSSAASRASGAPRSSWSCRWTTPSAGATATRCTSIRPSRSSRRRAASEPEADGALFVHLHAAVADSQGKRARRAPPARALPDPHHLRDRHPALHRPQAFVRTHDPEAGMPILKPVAG
ncbi:MAG: hypothetical protein MZU91_07695 [Desulfosudis oleivorans]|nr:hypothetical protein [Desulfosudis oleivorans]